MLDREYMRGFHKLRRRGNRLRGVLISDNDAEMVASFVAEYMCRRFEKAKECLRKRRNFPASGEIYRNDVLCHLSKARKAMMVLDQLWTGSGIFREEWP